MTAIAQLPMYDPPEARAANDELWRAIAMRLQDAGLADVPRGLARHFDRHEAWRHEELLLGQSCGYPAMTAFRNSLRIVATPRYAVPGCEVATHRSFIIVPVSSRAECLEDLRGKRFALNSWDSNSGMNLPRLAFAPFASQGGFFGEIIETGSHAGSLAVVAGEGADAAAIDCVTHALLARHRPSLVASTRVLARTVPSPCLPFVTSRRTDAALIPALREAMSAALADPALVETRHILLLDGIEAADEENYLLLLGYEERARQMGYARLR
jgi:ABC-type phosphate/phosphonate transport system substrate-binding protein